MAVMSPALRLLVGAAALVVFAAGLKAASAIVAPLLFALFLTILCLPVLEALRRLRVPDGVAVVAILLGLAAVCFVLLTLVGSSIASFQQQLPVYEEHLQSRMEELFGWLQQRGLTEAQGLRDMVSPGAVMRFAGSALQSFGSLFGNVLLVLLAVAFLLTESAALPAKLATTAKDGPVAAERVKQVIGSVNHYIALKTTISAMTGITVGIALWWIGVDYALLWALVAFLLNFVPNIGSFLAAVPPVLLALIQPGLGLSSSLLVAVVYVVANLVFGNVVEPRWMGSRLGLSTFVVFASLILWGYLLGPIGMLLSVPLTITLKIALESFPETRNIAIWLSERAPDQEPD
jgi:predicted PurR-regulated permease PerM